MKFVERKKGPPSGANFKRNVPKSNGTSSEVKKTSYAAEDGHNAAKDWIEQCMKGPNQVVSCYGRVVRTIFRIIIGVCDRRTP